MSKSRNPVGSSEASQLEKLINDLEFENRHYVKEIEKERQRLTATENNLAEHQTESDETQKEIERLDETTKNHHKQFKHNRDNIESLRKTIQVLSEHEEALQKDFENFNDKVSREREEWSHTLDRYKVIWEDYRTVYEDNELAKKLKHEQHAVKGKEDSLGSLRLRGQDVKGKIDQLENEKDDEFIPYDTLSAFVTKIAKVKLQNDQERKTFLSTQKEKSHLENQMKILQREIEIKGQEEKSRREDERRKSEEVERKLQEERKRREEEETRQLKLEEEKKKMEEEKKKLHEAKGFAVQKHIENSTELQRQTISPQRANRSVPTITIPTFNYANYRKSTLISNDGIPKNTENTVTKMNMSKGNKETVEILKKQSAVLERPPVPCSPPFSLAAMATSNLPLLRKVQESQLQRKVLDEDMPTTKDDGEPVSSTSQNQNRCFSGLGSENVEVPMEEDMTDDIRISSDSTNSPGPDRTQTVSCPKSPFDLQKHRERVKQIQKSPEGFAFTKRDMSLYSTDPHSKPQEDKSVFSCPPIPETRPKQLSPTTKQGSASNASMYSDGSGDGNRYQGVREITAMDMFAGSANAETSTAKPQFSNNSDISDNGGNPLAWFGPGDESGDGSDGQAFSFNFGVADDKSSPDGVFNMF